MTNCCRFCNGLCPYFFVPAAITLLWLVFFQGMCVRMLFFWLAACPSFLAEVGLFAYQPDVVAAFVEELSPVFVIAVVRLSVVAFPALALLARGVGVVAAARLLALIAVFVVLAAARREPELPLSASLQRTWRPLYVVPSRARMTFSASFSGTSKYDILLIRSMAPISWRPSRMLRLTNCISSPG